MQDTYLEHVRKFEATAMLEQQTKEFALLQATAILKNDGFSSVAAVELAYELLGLIQDREAGPQAVQPTPVAP